MPNEESNKKICPVCGFGADKNAIFCPKCGTSLLNVRPVPSGAEETVALPTQPVPPVPEVPAAPKRKKKGLAAAIILVIAAAAFAIAVLVFPEQLGIRKTDPQPQAPETAASSAEPETYNTSKEQEPEPPTVEDSSIEVKEEGPAPEEEASEEEAEAPAEEEPSAEEVPEESPAEEKATAEEQKAQAEAAYIEAFQPEGSYDLKTPKITELEVNRKGNVVIQWETVKGGEHYRLLRYNVVDDEGWVILGDFTDEQEFVDTTAVFYGEYYYGVRVIDDLEEYISGMKITHEIMPRPAPSELAARRVGDSIEITWGEVERCARYRVYRKTEDGWENIGESTINHFTDSSVEAGKEYTYTVRCLSSSGKTIVSGYDKNGVTVEAE